MGRPIIDLTGRMFGRLEVLRRDGSNRQGRSVWLCRCACGREHRAASSNLTFGNVQSCGCLLTEYCQDVANKINCPCSRAKLEELYLDGESANAIGKRFGVSCDTASRWLREADVTLRSVSQRNRLAMFSARAKNLSSLHKAHTVRNAKIHDGNLSIFAHLRLPKVRAAARRTMLKINAARRAKQQAEREQAEAIERSLNGDTFR